MHRKSLVPLPRVARKDATLPLDEGQWTVEVGLTRLCAIWSGSVMMTLLR